MKEKLTICAWCGKVLNNIYTDRNIYIPGNDISHGICEKCKLLLVDDVNNSNFNKN